jgi:hypothetical protein
VIIDLLAKLDWFEQTLPLPALRSLRSCILTADLKRIADRLPLQADLIAVVLSSSVSPPSAKSLDL